MRPGFGVRHPALDELLATCRPVGSGDAVWAGGRVPLRITAFAEPAVLPDEIVTSVRCIVDVRDRVVLCQNRDGEHHAWPGGRREPGESYADTARREVHEETGWLIDVDSLREVGWLHFELKRPPIDASLPHPDFLQVVMRATASSRDGGESADWTDIEGYEMESRLVSPAEAHELVDGDPLCRLFL